MAASKSYWAFSGIMGLYGASRGFRVNTMWNSHEKKLVPVHLLMGHRIMNGVINGVYYALPFWNICYLFRLVNRLEIRYNGWPPANHCDEFKEFNGYCEDTF